MLKCGSQGESSESRIFFVLNTKDFSLQKTYFCTKDSKLVKSSLREIFISITLFFIIQKLLYFNLFAYF
ncbi:MAG: hypothetical protein CVU08_07240 [Bacteroidetes bacterium HGW-Bacteroidetes-3]|jgi:hypothetical protein|nr:MAG: hypothetical protein CVU08_07240 [Bacteroidetes bacterium HGW-Bacteroidetes-3]